MALHSALRRDFVLCTREEFPLACITDKKVPVPTGSIHVNSSGSCNESLRFHSYAAYMTSFDEK